jgi:4-hydroxy-tetrahydrodipicolinate synthase
MGSFFAPKDWGRLLTAMVTPFDEVGAVNLPEARRIARYLVDDQLNDGIVVNGTTGESPTLEHDEKLALLEAVLDEVGDRAAVVFGAGTYNTKESIELTEVGTKAGAHGIMLVNPYYNRPGQDGMYAHFSTVAAKTDLPVMIYNIQPRSAINLETPTLMRLAEIENIVAVKEASGNIPQIQDVCAQAPCGFRVYSGDDALTLPILSVGGHGIVSVAGHIVGSQIKALLNAYPSDPEEAKKIHLSLLPVYHALFAYPNPVPVKFALAKRGFDTERVRLPLVELSPEQKSLIEGRLV